MPPEFKWRSARADFFAFAEDPLAQFRDGAFERPELEAQPVTSRRHLDGAKQHVGFRLWAGKKKKKKNRTYCSATVDGEAADILKANVLFRAVEVTPGRHRLRFEFRPLEGAIAELGERIFGESEEVSTR